MHEKDTNYSLVGLHDLPDNWVCTTLDSIADIVAGNPAPQGSEYFQGGSYPFVRVQDMGKLGNSKLMTDTNDHVNVNGASKLRLIPKGTVLFTKSGASTLLNQRAILTKDMYIVSHIAGAIPNKNILSEWIYYWLNTVDFRYLAHATTLPSLPLSKAKKIKVPVAPKNEQKRIVAEIEKQFSRLDEAVENLQRVKANLKRYKASVLKAAVEGKLTEQWRAGHPDVEPASQLLERILKERRKKWEENELAKMKAKGKVPKGDKWKSRFQEPDPLDTSALSKLPETWSWTRIEDVGHVQLGRQRAPKYHSGANMRPYLRVQNVFEDRIDLDDVMEMDFPHNDFKNYQLKSGDILLNEGQSPELLGRPAIYRGELPNACFTNTLIRFQVFSPMKPDFSLLVFRAYMRSRRFTKAGTITTNIAHLSAGRFAKIEYPLPPLEEQDEIVKESQKLLSIIDAFSIETDRAMVRAERLRQSILKKAFSGRLVPSNQDYDTDSADDLPLAAEQSAEYGVQN